jgi:hypothetical protein
MLYFASSGEKGLAEITQSFASVLGKDAPQTGFRYLSSNPRA